MCSWKRFCATPKASGAALNSDNGPGKLFLILNERRFSELIAAVLLQCQLFLLVYSVAVVQPSADNVCTLAPVTSLRTLSEISDASSAVDGVEAQFSNSNK